MEQLDFIWNKHGVCTNPEEIRVENNRAKAGIDLAMFKGRWYVGFEYHLFVGSEEEGICGGAGLPGKTGKSFKTKQEAMMYAYKHLLNHVSHKPTLLKLVKDNRHQFLQLQLF